MQIEKINENKIKIILNTDDLIERNIDLHSFMSESLEKQDIFFQLLKEAKKAVGFETLDHKLIIEALFTKKGIFVFIITKIPPKNKIIKAKKSNPQLKMTSKKNFSCIYQFKTFDNISGFCTYLHNNKMLNLLINLNSSLYKFNKKYFLILENKVNSSAELNTLFAILSEFSEQIPKTSSFLLKLQEAGEVLVPNNALKILNKYFKE